VSTKHHSSVDELAERTYQCISRDVGALEAHSQALPDHQRGDRTIHELDLSDFAVIAGVAYAIARGEDPFEPDGSVVERAGAAAALAHDRWGQWEVTYEQDRAARPVPLIYPGPVRAGRAVPWESIEDVSNGLEKIEPLVGEEDRERLRAMYDELQAMALRLFGAKRDDGEAVA
jgi:hypothetical protein